MCGTYILNPMERGSLVEDLSTNTHFFFFLNFLPEVYIGTYIHKLGVLLHRQIIGGVENDTQNYTYPCIYIYIDIRLLYIYIYIYILLLLPFPSQGPIYS
jgi:hypothetical protein